MSKTLKIDEKQFSFEKDKKGKYIGMSLACAKVHGFKSINNVIGKTDYDLPTDMSKFADVFRANDAAVIKEQKLHKFLEIQPCSDNVWRTFYVEKKPLLIRNKISGTQAIFYDISYISEILIQNIALQAFLLDITKKSPIIQGISEKISMLSQKRKACLFYYIIGKPIKSIAQKLEISPRTVEDHIDAIKRSFHFSYRSQLHSLINEQTISKIFSSILLKEQSSLRILD